MAMPCFELNVVFFGFFKYIQYRNVEDFDLVVQSKELFCFFFNSVLIGLVLQLISISWKMHLTDFIF